MINTVSQKFLDIVKGEGRTFRAKIVINNKEYTEFRELKLTKSCESGDSLSFGSCFSSSINVTIPNFPKTTVISGQKTTLYVGLKIDNSLDTFDDLSVYEWIKLGEFIISNPMFNDDDLSFMAYDNFYLCENVFTSDLKGSQKIKTIVNEQCIKLGIGYVDDIEDVYYDIDVLKGLTIREAFGYLASYLGTNAIFNEDGKLQFVWYKKANTTINAERFTSPLSIGENDIVIRSINCVTKESTTDENGNTLAKDKTIIVGEGEGISFSNPYITESRLNVLLERTNNFTFRTCQMSWLMAEPQIQIGDIITVEDITGNYIVPIMDMELSIDGGCNGTIKSKFKNNKSDRFQGSLSKRVERNYTEYASFKEVTAEKITAFSGQFEKVDTDILNVNKELNALKGTIESLDVGDLTVRVSKIETSYVDKQYVNENYVNIQYANQTYAVKSEIKDLTTDVAKINTLLSGSVTSGSTQTIVLNAENTTIANALIKDANIDSLSFNKMTGVDFNTSKFSVHSNDGLSTWKDNTILIKDSVRNRVQIGKDAQGDYNIYIWDKNGKLMFDPLGLTEDGVNREVIDNSNVKEDAGIKGSKLDIDSVVTSINGATTTIKSSKIFFDDKKQSLDVVFNTMSNTVEENSSKLNAQSTQISTVQGQISTLITDVTQAKKDITATKADVTTAKGNITTLTNNYSSLKQTVDGINSTVANHTSQITNVQGTANNALNLINNLEIGGKNLAQQSNEMKAGGCASGITCIKNSDGSISVTATAGNGNWMSSFYMTSKGIEGQLNEGDVFTISFYMSSSDTSKVPDIYIKQGMGYYGMKGSLSENISTVYYTGTWKKANDISLHLGFNKIIGTVRIYKWKIEKGNRPTDWTPSPEDIDDQINTVNKNLTVSIETVSDKATKLEQSLDGFKTSVSNTYATKTQLNTVDGKFASYSTTTAMNSAITQAKNEISQKVTSVETNVTNITKTVNDNKANWDKAPTALTNANNAQATANTAKLLHEVETISGNLRKFKNVCGYTKDDQNVKGCIIITTPITPSRMVSVHIKGYNYVSNQETIDLTIGFYNYTNSFISNGYINNGSFKFNSIKVAKVSSTDNRAVIMLGDIDTVWQYPKIIVDEVIVGYSTASPDSYKDGFSCSLVTTIPTTYTNVTALSGTDFKTEITTTKNTVAEHTTSLNNITSRVSTTESNITKINGNITALQEFKNTAEQKITDSAIVATVTKSTSWSNLNNAATTANNTANSALTKANNLIDLTTIKDTRSTNENPQWYMTNYANKTVKEFKYCTTVGVTGEGTYGVLVTEVTWANSSGGYPTQLFYPSESQNVYRRVGTSTTSWGAWTKVAGTHNAISIINQTAESIKIQASKISLEGIVTANSKFKILTDGSMEAVNGKFTGNINAIGGTIGGIKINEDGISSFKTDKHNVTRGYGINNDGSIFSSRTGEGRDYMCDINAGIISISSHGTFSGSMPQSVDITSNGMSFYDSGDIVSSLYVTEKGYLEIMIFGERIDLRKVMILDSYENGKIKFHTLG
ncbi:MAG: hypothetical protein ACLUVC_02105 [Longibaculum sp.]